MTNRIQYENGNRYMVIDLEDDHQNYIDQLISVIHMEDTECTLYELPTAMNERGGWKHRVKNL